MNKNFVLFYNTQNCILFPFQTQNNALNMAWDDDFDDFDEDEDEDDEYDPLDDFDDLDDVEEIDDPIKQAELLKEFEDERGYDQAFEEFDERVEDDFEEEEIAEEDEF